MPTYVPFIDCFVVEPLARGRRFLHRYQGLHRGYDCYPTRRHEASVVHDDIDLALDNHKRNLPMASLQGGEPAPAWPPRCAGPACPIEGGYIFKPDDPGNVVVKRLGRRADTGEEVLLYEPPVGAIIDITEHTLVRGPDGRALCVMTPDGLWYIDSPHVVLEAKWSREGDLPRITITQIGGAPHRWTVVGGVLHAVSQENPHE